MSAPSSPVFKSGFVRHNTDVLIEARARINEVLDLRARQWSLFEDKSTPDVAKVQICTESPTVCSPSTLNTFLDCGAFWWYRKVLGIPDRRTLALGLGTAVHEALAANFKAKIETKEDMDVDGVRSVFRDSFEKQLDEITLSDDDDIAEVKNCGETMLRVYMDQAAPTIKPAAVEKPVSGRIGDVPVSGFIDLIDVNGNIIDLKTSSRKPAGISAAHRRQIATYAMLEPTASGYARIDTLTKTKTVALHSQTAYIGSDDRRHMEKLYSIALEQMRSGLVLPNRSSFKCSKRLCAYHAQCCDDFGGIVE